MRLERRLAKLETTRDARPDPNATANFAALAATLDRLAARKAAGDETAQAEIQALALAGNPSAAQAFALSVLTRKHGAGGNDH